MSIISEEKQIENKKAHLASILASIQEKSKELSDILVKVEESKKLIIDTESAKKEFDLYVTSEYAKINNLNRKLEDKDFDLDEREMLLEKSINEFNDYYFDRIKDLEDKELNFQNTKETFKSEISELEKSKKDLLDYYLELEDIIANKKDFLHSLNDSISKAEGIIKTKNDAIISLQDTIDKTNNDFEKTIQELENKRLAKIAELEQPEKFLADRNKLCEIREKQLDIRIRRFKREFNKLHPDLQVNI